MAAAGYLANWALSMVAYRGDSHDTQWGILAVDGGLLALYVYLALRTSRYWPLFAAAFQLLAVLTHIARALDTAVSGWAYMTAGLVWSYLVIATVGYGAWTAPYFAKHAPRQTMLPRDPRP